MKQNPIVSGYVYSLSYNGTVFYVGSTRYSLRIRLSTHMTASKGIFQVAPVHKHIKEMGMRPEINIVEDLDDVELSYLRQREYYWIDYFRSLGFELKNHFSNNTISRKGYKKNVYKS